MLELKSPPNLGGLQAPRPLGDPAASEGKDPKATGSYRQPGQVRSAWEDLAQWPPLPCAPRHPWENVRELGLGAGWLPPVSLLCVQSGPGEGKVAHPVPGTVSLAQELPQRPGSPGLLSW